MDFSREHVVVLVGASRGIRRVQRSCASCGIVCASPTGALHAVRRYLFEENPASTTIVASLDAQTRESLGDDLCRFMGAARALPGVVRCIGLLTVSDDLHVAATLGFDWYLHDELEADRMVDLFLNDRTELRSWCESAAPAICTGRFGQDLISKDDAPESDSGTAARRWAAED